MSIVQTYCLFFTVFVMIIVVFIFNFLLLFLFTTLAMRTANAITWTGQMSVVHLCLKLLYVLYCYCEASLSLGKALYKLNIIIIVNLLSVVDLVSKGLTVSRQNY